MPAVSTDKPTPSAKILVVDDHPANLTAVAAVLASLGEPIVLARSGEEALQHLLADEFAVVLLDVMMPGMTGFDVARMMRARERTRNVPLIFLTARDPQERDVLQGYLHRASDYLVKPFAPEVLRAKVSVFVELFHAREAARQLAREEERRAQAESDRQRFVALLVRAPVASAVLAGPDHVVELANERFLKLANRPVPPGQPLVDIFPELAGSPVIELLDRLHAKPEPFTATAFPFFFDRKRDGNLEQAYFDFSLEPLRDDDGTLRLMGCALDVTEHVNARRVRDDFLGIASHELKTPLTTLRLQIDGLARLTGSAPRTPEELAPRLTIIRRQILRLDRLVDELLDVSRIAAGKLPIAREEVDLAELAREVVERLADEARAAGCAVTVHAPAPLVGQWDRMRVDQVITNLITNAMKYGARQPIEVTVTADDETAVLRVADHGIGIAPENHARVFERFERAVAERSYAGLGLGLWIVARIVADLGGKVRLESALGAGATFIVELPRTPPT